ncbi:MAG: 1-acyl-sn-glycerol-3-phosphate acyltransferase [Polaromonas sp.]
MTTDFQLPYPVQFRGSRVARAILRCAGWRTDFAGLPTLQGVVVVYPHTSNWDFVWGVLLKSALGVPLQFWGKDTLFRVPVLGAWLRWLGGVPVSRTAPHGVVGQMVALIQQKKARQEYFWLALSPEGTRRQTPGWRSGFYRVALAADVPVGLARLDYGQKRLVLREFVRLSGDEAADMARIARAFEGCLGRHPGTASPVRLMNPSAAREAGAATIVNPANH